MTRKEVVLDAVMLVMGHDHEATPADFTCPMLKMAAEILEAVRTADEVMV